MAHNHFSRWKMYQRIDAFFQKEKKRGKLLLVGGGSHVARWFEDVTKSNIPDVDIHNMPYEDEAFDYVIADQVLEHVRKPWVAVEEIRRILKPGGYTILTTCLMNAIHWGPKDYWRFTPDGLRVLCENFSHIEQCEGWGNWQCLLVCNTKERTAKVKPKSRLEKLANSKNDNNLIHVWAIARK